MKRLARLLGTFIERRPLLLIAAAAVVTAVAALGFMQVEIRTSQDMLISRHSKTFRDYDRYSRQFGGGPILVLFSGDLNTLLSPSNLDTMAGLQQELEADSRIKLVVSPLTFLEAAAVRAAPGRGADPQALARDPRFIRSAAFNADGSVNPQLGPVIPDGRHVLMTVRLEGGLSLDEQKAVAGDVRAMVEAHPFSADDVLVAGTPMLVRDLVNGIQRSMAVTGLLAIVLMVAVLFLVFPVRWRLLSLPLVLVGVLWTFGVMGLVDMPVTIVTMAGLPILIGLGVDYAIQFHNRYEEELRRGDSPAAAVIDAITHIGPAVGIAVLATILGFIVLLISPVPMIRDFGVMITVGVALLYLVCFLLLNAVLYRRDKGRPVEAVQPAQAASPARVERLLTAIAKQAIRFPLPIIVAAVLLSGAGLWLDRQLSVQTDIEKLIPPDTPALADLNRAREVVGSTTEISMLIEGEDVTRPEVLSWIEAYQQAELAKHSELISADSISSALAGANGAVLPPTGSGDTLAALPPAVHDSLVSSDHRAASINFGVKLIPFDDMNRLVDQLAADAQPPAGFAATPAGQIVLGARTSTALTANRELIALAALAAVAFGLMLVYRSLARSAVAILPITFITGWSSGLMFFAGIDLNPLTAVLGALIIGIGTEFTVLLMERYYEEKAKGLPPLEAMETAVSKVGRAITASSLTVIAGFGTLVASDFPMLQDFGKVIVVDVLLALGATLIILPAIVVWLDGRVPSLTTVFAWAGSLARCVPPFAAERHRTFLTGIRGSMERRLAGAARWAIRKLRERTSWRV